MKATCKDAMCKKGKVKKGSFYFQYSPVAPAVLLNFNFSWQWKYIFQKIISLPNPYSYINDKAD